MMLKFQVKWLYQTNDVDIVPLGKEDSFLEVHLHLLRETSIWTFSTNWTLQVEAGLSKKFSKHFIPAFEKLKWSKAASMYGPLLPALGKLQWFGCLGLSVLGNVSNGHCRPALSLTKWMALLTSTACIGSGETQVISGHCTSSVDRSLGERLSTCHFSAPNAWRFLSRSTSASSKCIQYMNSTNCYCMKQDYTSSLASTSLLHSRSWSDLK